MEQQNFNDLKGNLSESDIDQLVKLLGYKCQVKTISRLRSVLTYGPNTIPAAGIFNRLIKEGGRWEYVAGQHYPSEIKLVRDLITKG
jgi:hypothetical protein